MEITGRSCEHTSQFTGWGWEILWTHTPIHGLGRGDPVNTYPSSLVGEGRSCGHIPQFMGGGVAEH